MKTTTFFRYKHFSSSIEGECSGEEDLLLESNDVQNICVDDSSHIESDGTDEFYYNNHNNISSHVTDDGSFENLEESELPDPEQERPYTNAENASKSLSSQPSGN